MKKVNKKVPWIAALLNVILSGLGYIYVGKRKLFGCLLLIGEILAFAWLSIDRMSIAILSNAWVSIAGILWTTALAVDGYNDAKET